MSPTQIAVLVAVLDADLRARAFEQLMQGGFRVDAVADVSSAMRRFECDDYELAVVEEGEAFAGLECPVPHIHASLDSVDTLARQARRKIGLEDQHEDSGDEPTS